jgi:bile acid:Na+ symporter, BASS family
VNAGLVGAHINDRITMKKIAFWIEQKFLLLAILLTALALFYPSLFTWFSPYISQLLGIVMFGMGLTLEVTDFLKIWEKRLLVLAGISLQFVIMPLLGWSIATVMQLPRDEFIGLVIVGCCPGGTASNVITYIARANVPLSVVLTLSTTLLAPIVTPILIYLSVRTKIDLDILPLMTSIFWIIIFPLIDGLILRRLLRKQIEPIVNIFPAVSIVFLLLIIACIVGLNRTNILTFPGSIIAAVMIHNILGLILGYWGGRFFKMDEADCRTVGIEVGMQNSALGVALASQFVSPAAALPSAIFSLWHNLSGITLAKYWSKKLP